MGAPRAVIYSPSALERRWAAGVAGWQAEGACAKMLDVHSSAGLDLVGGDVDGMDAAVLLVEALELQAQAVAAGGAAGGERGRAALDAYRDALRGPVSALLSQLGSGPDSRGGASILLEPVWGLLRDPRMICKYFDPTSALVEPLLDTAMPLGMRYGAEPGHWFIGQYFLLDPFTLAAFSAARAAATPPPGVLPPRALYFDAGASFFGDGFGLKPMLAYYAALGLEMDEAWAWEARNNINGGDFFTDAPLRIQSRTHFVNRPVSADLGDKNNPLAVIAAVARPQDYVVFKLDIDNGALEHELVRQLGENATLLRLVDEFFFEDHVSVEEFRFFWSESYGGPRDLAAAHKLLAGLREKGVRAHAYP